MQPLIYVEIINRPMTPVPVIMMDASPPVPCTKRFAARKAKRNELQQAIAAEAAKINPKKIG